MWKPAHERNCFTILCYVQPNKVVVILLHFVSFWQTKDQYHICTTLYVCTCNLLKQFSLYCLTYMHIHSKPTLRRYYKSVFIVLPYLFPCTSVFCRCIELALPILNSFLWLSMKYGMVHKKLCDMFASVHEYFVWCISRIVHDTYVANGITKLARGSRGD